MIEQQQIPEATDMDLEQIAQLIKGGYTSGRIDSGDKHIYFEIKTNVWSDNE